MTKLIILLFMMALPTNVWARSEMKGYISNDPKRPGQNINDGNNSGNGTGGATGGQNSEQKNTSGGNGILVTRHKTSQQNEDKTKNIVIEKNKISVLGFDRLPDNTLVRDSRGKIYVIRGEIKKVIWDLRELRKFSDQPILDLPDSDLAKYPTRRFYNCALIRLKGDSKVYLVVSGQKHQIKSPGELKLDYSGQIIYNIDKEEFDLY
jgi:hypothetical protein